VSRRLSRLAAAAALCVVVSCVKRPAPLSYVPPPPASHRLQPPLSPPRPAPVPRAEPISGEKYRDYGINDFVDASVDPLSTFAVDVDTASYTVTRRMLEQGYLPPPEAVRVEEFVNYLPYRYVAPERDPFSVDFDAAPSPYDEGVTLLRVGIQGRPVDDRSRRPAHLTFLVDVSGSMRAPDKLDLVKTSLEMLALEMRDGDTIAIATYAGAEKVVLEPTGVEHRDHILRSLHRLTSGGSTAMGSGIELAYRLAEASRVDGHINRVIVCSDGDANVGRTDPEAILSTIRGHAQRGITLTSLGFGNGNYNDVMMERLADEGDGNYFYVDSKREAYRVLVQRLTSTLEVIARDVKLQLAFDPTVVADYRLVGYENRDIADEDFRDDAVDAGEIGAGHQVTALYELHLRPGVSGRIATMRVRNEAPGRESPAVERTFPVDTDAVQPTFAEASLDTQVATAAAWFADKLRGTPYLDEISYAQLARLARDAARPEMAEDAELVSLIERAGQLAGEGFASR
jgi:Ca-activated chloride channel homolog